MQVIHGYRDVTFDVVELPGINEDQLRELVRQTHERPFDLARESIFRATLFRRATDESILLLTVHHIAYDGWSLWLNQNELRTLYAQEIGGEKPLRIGAVGLMKFDAWDAVNVAE